MRSTTAGSTNPWGTSLDDAWKDLVVSSAPPPPSAPPPIPQHAAESGVRNRPMPNDLATWQEHGAPRVPSVELPVEEPSFSASDRRLWLIAGTLMGLAALVLGVLGMLTFGGGSSSLASAPPVAAPTAVEPAHAAAVESARPATPSARTTVATHASNPRVLKGASHSNKARHHKNKKVAER